MVKNFVNSLFLFVIVIIIMVGIFSDNFKNTKTQIIENTNDYYDPYPVYITPSNIRTIPNVIQVNAEVITLNDKHHNKQERLSPSSSYTESTICNGGMTIGNIQNVSDKKKMGYVFNESGRKFDSIGEKITCKIFEEFLSRVVTSHLRPKWIINPLTGKSLELDFYDEKTKIALEYNGIQHYKSVDFFDSKNSKSLNYRDTDSDKRKNEIKKLNTQQYRDKVKSKCCVENNVHLIVIPYTIDTTSPDKNGILKYKRYSEKILIQYCLNLN